MKVAREPMNQNTSEPNTPPIINTPRPQRKLAPKDKKRLYQLAFLGVLIVIGGIVTMFSDGGPQYLGKFGGYLDKPEDGGTSYVFMTVDKDGTFYASLEGFTSEVHKGTYKIASSNETEVVFTVTKVQSDIHESAPYADAGLAVGSLKWRKQSDGKEILDYSYRHKSGRGESFHLPRMKD